MVWQAGTAAEELYRGLRVGRDWPDDVTQPVAVAPGATSPRSSLPRGERQMMEAAKAEEHKPGQSDQEKVLELAGLLHDGNARTALAHVEWLREETDRLLAWGSSARAVERVAEALLERETLSGADVRGLLRADAGGRGP